MSEFAVGLSDVRKKLLEDLQYGAHKFQSYVQPQQNSVGSVEIGNRLGKGDIHPSSSTAASF